MQENKIELAETGPMVFDTEEAATEYIKSRLHTYGTSTLKLDEKLLEDLKRGRTIVFDVNDGEFVAKVVGFDKFA